MARTSRSTWLLTLSVLLFTFGNLFGALRTEFFPHGFKMISRVSVPIYLPFLLGFALIGTLGAYWSRRMRWEPAIQVGLFVLPVVALVGTFAMLRPVNFTLLAEAHSWNIGHFMECFFRWVLFPIVALIGGALSFLLRSNGGRNQRGRSLGAERSH